MKKFLSISLALLMIIFFVASCKKNEGGDGDMLYTSDTALGNGSTVFTLVVEHIDGTKIKDVIINGNRTIEITCWI